MDPKKTLILTVGLPRSGKTTWACQQDAPIVNPDSIRLAIHGQVYIPESEKIVWVVAHYMVKALFLAGHTTVIVDATNITEKRRVDWESDDWVCEHHLFNANKDTCILRAHHNGREDLIPVIERMAEKMDSEICKL